MALPNHTHTQHVTIQPTINRTQPQTVSQPEYIPVQPRNTIQPLGISNHINREQVAIVPTINRSQAQTINQPELIPVQHRYTSPIANPVYSTITQAPGINQDSTSFVRPQDNASFYIRQPAFQ